jgi:hypothetical protein
VSDGVDTIRETPLGNCIGATILDITAIDPDEFLETGKNQVYFHLSNGETIFATLGTDGDGLVGMLGDDDEEEVAGDAK